MKNYPNEAQRLILNRTLREPISRTLPSLELQILFAASTKRGSTSTV